MTRLLPCYTYLRRPYAEAQTLTVTGPHGTVSGTCDRPPQTCTTHSTTGLNGATGSRSRVTTATKGQITSSLTGTRATGQTFTRTATITR